MTLDFFRKTHMKFKCLLHNWIGGSIIPWELFTHRLSILQVVGKYINRIDIFLSINLIGLVEEGWLPGLHNRLLVPANPLPYCASFCCSCRHLHFTNCNWHIYRLHSKQITDVHFAIALDQSAQSLLKGLVNLSQSKKMVENPQKNNRNKIHI